MRGQSVRVVRSLVTIQTSWERHLYSLCLASGKLLCYKTWPTPRPEQPFFGLQSRGLSGTEKPLTSMRTSQRRFWRRS